MALEQIGKNTVDGAKVPGQHHNVISDGVSTRQLTPAESGSLCVFDTAAGVVYTLPTPVVGMYFDFAYSVKTTGEYKLITKTVASEFLVGFLGTRTTTAIAGTDGFVANGTTHVALASDGGATGGDAGGWVRVVATSTTQWSITGDMYCGTTVGTDPFTTS